MTISCGAKVVKPRNLPKDLTKAMAHQSHGQPHGQPLSAKMLLAWRVIQSRLWMKQVSPFSKGRLELQEENQ
jgi:hypothetical protein